MRKSLVFLSLILLVYGVWAQSSRRTASPTASVHFPPKEQWLHFQKIDAERIRAHVRFLSHDLLEGRGTGQRGGDITGRIHRHAIFVIWTETSRRQRNLPAEGCHGRGHTSAGNDIFSGVCERLESIEPAF